LKTGRRTIKIDIMAQCPETRIAQHPKLRRGGNVIVGVSGIDGAGKSTYTDRLAEQLLDRGVRTRKIALDGFFHPKPIRNANSDQITGYFDESFDFESLIQNILQPVRAHRTVQTELQVRDLVTDKLSSGFFTFEGPGVLIVEGVFLFRRELRPHFDLKIWVDVSFETATDRVVNRPRDRRHGDADAIKHRYEERYFAAQRFHLERDNPIEAADMIVANP
jgi:uridine kinase